MKTLLKLTILLSLSIFQALVLAWSLSKYWQWLVQSEYGDGPSIKVWFGLSVIVGLMLAVPLVAVTRKLPRKDKDESDTDYISWVESFLPLAVIFGLLIGLAHTRLVMLVMGWS